MHDIQEIAMEDTRKYNRREVIQKGLTLGLVAGSTVILGKTDLLMAKGKPSK